MEIDQIKNQARQEHIPIMVEEGMQFLCDYLKNNIQLNDILEVGSAVGYSAMNFARIRQQIKVDTIEIDEQLYLQAVKNVADSNLANQITCIHSDALVYTTDKQYDFIFIDAAKGQYKNYLEHFYDNSHKGTIFAFDNVSFHGMIDHPQLTTNKRTLNLIKRIKKFRDWILVEPRFSVDFHEDIGDGILIAKRIR